MARFIDRLQKHHGTKICLPGACNLMVLGVLLLWLMTIPLFGLSMVSWLEQAFTN
jgi:hypothetical protein